MGFRYYVTDMLRGVIEGTNDTLLADKLAYREGYLIVDAVKGERVLAAGDRQEVTEIEKSLNRQVSYDQFRTSLRLAKVKLHERRASHHGETSQDAPAKTRNLELVKTSESA